MGIKVAKVRRSSVAGVIQFKKVKEHREADPTRSVLVVSAPGKRYETDTKLTDLLYLCQTHVEHNLPWDQLFQVVRDRFTAMALSLGLSADALALEREFDTIRDDLNGGAGGDYIASRGEYLNALLMAHFLGFDFVDATELILFDERGHLMEQETQDAISEVSQSTSGPSCRVSTEACRKVGSRRSAGRFRHHGCAAGQGSQADVYENWTDVHGFLVADPRIVKPQPIGPSPIRSCGSYRTWGGCAARGRHLPGAGDEYSDQYQKHK